MIACTTNADDDEQPALAEAIADERGAGDRHRAEQRFFPEAGLERVGDRREPRRVGREHVGMEQRFGRRPPAEAPSSREIEHDVVGEEDARRADTRDTCVRGSPSNCPGSFAPHAPELRMRSEGAARQRLGRHERQREEHGEADEPRDHQRDLLRDERRPRHRRVVRHPHQRPVVDRRERLEQHDDDAPENRPAPDHPALPQHQEQADADAADHVEQRQSDDRADADRLVGRSHARRSAG